MKRTLCVVLVLSFALGGKDLTAQYVRLNGGMNLASILSPDEENLLGIGNIIGLHVGFGYEIPNKEKPYSFETGLRYSVKGFDAVVFGVSFKMRIFYLEAPLLMKRYWDVGNETRFFLSAGPYIGVGLSGDYSLRGNFLGVFNLRNSGTIRWGEDFLPMDMGLSLGVGIQVDSYDFGMWYDRGAMYVTPYTAKVYHNVWRFSLGYSLPFDELIKRRK